jgi:signal recognition particle subunit SRP54
MMTRCHGLAFLLIAALLAAGPALAAEKKSEKDQQTRRMQQMQRMGGLGALAGMLPGMKKLQGAASGMDDRILVRMDAIISSMTKKERTKPELLQAKRKIRIANGSGTTVQEVNKLLKMHQEMSILQHMSTKGKIKI